MSAGTTVTAHAMTGDGARCMQAGCNGYLPKPFRIGELLTAVAEHVLGGEDT